MRRERMQRRLVLFGGTTLLPRRRCGGRRCCGGGLLRKNLRCGDQRRRDEHCGRGQRQTFMVCESRDGHGSSPPKKCIGGRSIPAARLLAPGCAAVSSRAFTVAHASAQLAAVRYHAPYDVRRIDRCEGKEV